MQENERIITGDEQKPLEDSCYEAPAIIYEGMINTRAGTTLEGPVDDGKADGVDLFGD